MKNHQKHTNIEKPQGGKFHPLEWGIMGAPCGVIQKLAKAINHNLEDKKIGYIDQLHQASLSDKSLFYQEFTDKISHLSYSSNQAVKPFSYRKYFSGCHAVIVNGNHYIADAQIVVINQKKKDSLHRKLKRLTDVKMFVLDHGETDIYPFLKECLPHYRTIPIYRISEIRKIADHIREETDNHIPPLDGLLLWGGNSTRMGIDKATISYHGIPQWKHLTNLLQTVCTTSYISGNEKDNYPEEIPLIRDSFVGLGPYGGLLSKFRKHPNRAILCLPCDVPLIDFDMINLLAEERDPRAIATCYHNPETNFPEPLITIWEPKAYPILLDFLSLGYSCPRKVLINSDANVIHCKTPEKLFNANNQDEMNLALHKLKQSATKG